MTRYERDEEKPEPCTRTARDHGCTCSMETVNSASIDPPEPIIDPWCPVHGGRDPDLEYDRQRDDAMFDAPPERDADDY